MIFLFKTFSFIRFVLTTILFRKLNVQLTQQEVPKVIGGDGGDLGSMGTVQLMFRIGTSKVTQDFIVCRELRRNIILGVDFAKRNCAGIQ